MANPFLMEDDLPSSNEPYSNPFLMEDLEDDSDENKHDQNEFIVQTNDNPFFMDQSNDLPGNNGAVTNPFSNFDDPNALIMTTTSSINLFDSGVMKPITTNANFFSSDIQQNDINHSTHFFDTTINEDEPLHHIKPSIDLNTKKINTASVLFDDGIAYSSEDELNNFKKKAPPPRPGPPLPSKATQDLIMSVANELDQASSHLLDRLPKTRTPSPVSIRDLHSPSPTPDIGDLLDVSEDHPSNFFDDHNDDLMGGSTPNPISDNLFDIKNNLQSQQGVPKEDLNKPQPPRPPPPRPAPPSRPSPVSHFPPAIPSQPHRPPPPAVHPPRPLPPAAAQPIVHQEPDLFDMFGPIASVPPPKATAPKTKEDILSLYTTAPSNPAGNNNTNVEMSIMPDLLSGDFLDDSIPLENAVPAQNDLVPDFPEQAIQQPEVIEIIEQELPAQIISQPVSQKSSPSLESSAIVAKNSTTSPAVLTPSEELQNFNFATVEEIIEPRDSSVPDLIPSAVSPSRAIIFNVQVTCEPDNPPSDEEDDLDYQPKPSQQAPVPFVEEPDPNSDGVASDQADFIPNEDFIAQTTHEIDSNPFSSTPGEITDVVVELVLEPDTICQPPPTPATGMDLSGANDIYGEANSIASSIQINKEDDAFDAFAAKFEFAEIQKSKSNTNIFLEDLSATSNGFDTASADAWGDSVSNFGNTTFVSAVKGDDSAAGFGGEEDGFDSFLAMCAPPPQPIPEIIPFERNDSRDSDEPKEFNVFIRPKEELAQGAITPVLAPPPKSSQNNSIYSGDSSPRFNPFDKGFEDVSSTEYGQEKTKQIERSESQESPATPLFDDDVSQPLEDFPRITYTGDGWEMQLRQPNKKRITAQRFWKKIFLKLTLQGDNPILQLYIGPNDKEPFQELPLQACYSVSDISAQQYDQFGKIFTVKLQYIFYKERPGVRPGQVTKAERLTSKLSQFAAYAIQGDYQGVKEFGSDLKKLGIPVEHAPQVSELFKLGSLAFEDMKQFSVCIEEALFKLDVHRDRALNYKTEEIQITAVDELFVEQDAEGHVLKQIARVRLFFLGFLSGMPYVELGVNDLWRQGKEVVGRHDIIPVVTEEWIRLEGVEFHTCVHQDEYEKTRTIKFQPPDACYIELMRFRVRPPKNRELPLQLKATWCVTGNKVELRADILVPGFASRKLGQIPCEDVLIRFPIPECWIYLFRVEKHFRYGSVKSAHRRTGKVKGIERILGAVEQLQESLIEVTSGSAKYEHQHRALVWRCPRLPKEGQGAYTTHQLVCRLALTSYDQIPDQLAPYCYVEFTMPATQVSHTTVRSVSIQESDSDDPPEKYVRYLARHEYKVGIEHTTNDTTNPYLAATMAKTICEEPSPPPKPVSPLPVVPQSDSDSDSN